MVTRKNEGGWLAKTKYTHIHTHTNHLLPTNPLLVDFFSEFVSTRIIFSYVG